MYFFTRWTCFKFKLFIQLYHSHNRNIMLAYILLCLCENRTIKCLTNIWIKRLLFELLLKSKIGSEIFYRKNCRLRRYDSNKYREINCTRLGFFPLCYLNIWKYIIEIFVLYFFKIILWSIYFSLVAW